MDLDVRKYLDLKVDDMKLKMIDGLSVGVSRVLVLVMLMLLAAIALAAFAFGIVLLLGELIGSWAAAAFIVGGQLLLILVVLVAVRKKLFLDIFVRLFIGIFYGKE